MWVCTVFLCNICYLFDLILTEFCVEGFETYAEDFRRFRFIIGSALEDSLNMETLNLFHGERASYDIVAP